MRTSLFSTPASVYKVHVHSLIINLYRFTYSCEVEDHSYCFYPDRGSVSKPGKGRFRHNRAAPVLTSC
jgi:hypothetical protein